ncbi:hypothetical protein HPB47_026509 [Ixodes persulcatus]|uniref:Uncharacterized protein n=1 Tax=Ixodes persulcatus TaxID=34615 RepID=A0AC60Q0D6_IXOPE|nr:hypothetical protein HPB47_026509 [Ixodes persulcatus]
MTALTTPYAQVMQDMASQTPLLDQKKGLTTLLKKHEEATLPQKVNLQEVRIPGYYHFYTPTILRKYNNEEITETRGEAPVYLQKTLLQLQIDTSTWCNVYQEIAAVRTTLEHQPHKVILVSAYIRPEARANETDKVKHNFEWIEHIRNRYPEDRIIIVGDFNAHQQA